MPANHHRAVWKNFRRSFKNVVKVSWRGSVASFVCHGIKDLTGIGSGFATAPRQQTLSH